jgi:isochorismate pyruvate lyase
MEFRRTFSGAPWEETVGYCRAVQAGNTIYVTGTAPVDAEGEVVGPGDGYAQAVRCIELIRRALEDLDSGLDQVVRTRILVTDIDRWEAYGRAHREAFGDHPPATTLVEVSRLIHPDMLVEMEAVAVTG